MKQARYKPRATWLRKTEYINNDLYTDYNKYDSEIMRQNKASELVEEANRGGRRGWRG